MEDLNATTTTAAAADGEALPTKQKPGCGLLVRTIVESPVIQWALPVYLRSPEHCDVAFIGEQFVQVCEVRRVGKSGKATQLHNIARHSWFGSKIHNAGILGLGSEINDPNPIPPSSVVNGPPHGLHGRSSWVVVPPHIIVLALEGGDLAFIFSRADGSIAQSRFSPEVFVHVDLGFHFAVDPSSRYMAAGSPDGLFMLYEVRPRDVMSEQYRTVGEMEPVKTCRVRGVQGVIQKMDFLFPHPEQPDHVILLLLVARSGVTRMVTYEWRAGDDLELVLSQEKRGHRLPPEHQTPLLVIPVKQRSAFLLVSEHSTLIIHDPLEGPYNIETVNIGSPPVTPHHHGRGPPLWTCWARGYRHKDYQTIKDDLFLAREDGAIVHVAFQAGLFHKTLLGTANCNISTAFTVILDRSFDFLFVGGDSSSGAVLQVAPRVPLQQLATIPNWTPVVDIVTTDGEPIGGSTSSFERQRRQPRRVFAAAGRGATATITEFRHGVEAEIGLDMEFGEPIKRCWIFFENGSGAETSSASGLDASGLDSSYHHLILLGLPDSSAVLHLSLDLSEAAMPNAEETPFDLSHRTLDAARGRDGIVIQVTEATTVVVTPSTRVLHTHEQVFGLNTKRVELAGFCGYSIVVVHHAGPDDYQLCFAEVLGDGSLVPTYRVGSHAEITCLASCRISARQFLLAGQWHAGLPLLTVYELRDGDCVERTTLRLSLGDAELGHTLVGLPTTITVITETNKGAALVAVGTRSGHLLILEVSSEARVVAVRHAERLSDMEVDILPLPLATYPSDDVLMVRAGSELILLSEFDHRYGPQFRSKQHIFPVDSNHPASPAPSIDFATYFGRSLTGMPNYFSALMVSGGRIMLADMRLHAQMVPRHLPIGCTPTKLLYARSLGCLVVAVLRQDRPTICFIDPESGRDVSYAIDHTGQALDFVAGLGKGGDRIYGLDEWLYPKNGKTFAFLVITTKKGQLLLLSAKRDGHGRIAYWTRFRSKNLGGPAYAVACHEQGLVLSVGPYLQWHKLDETEKSIVLTDTYLLDSPASSLSIKDGVVRSLTTDHSLVIVRRKAQGAMQSDEASFIVYSDQASRKTAHMISMGAAEGEAGGPPPLTLISDRYCGMALLQAHMSRQTSTEMDVLATDTLESSVRKFCQGRTRPYWSRLNNGPAKFGRIPSTVSDADVFGVSLDGALRHFTLLTPGLWKVLDLVQTLALSMQFNPRFGPHRRQHRDAHQVQYLTDEGAQPAEKPLRTIDGDLLAKVLHQRVLEAVVNSGEGEAVGRFKKLLDELEGGEMTAHLRDGSGAWEEPSAGYFALGYDILSYLLDAVL